MSRPHGAFTLIELIVVISIILVLMALLVPIVAVIWKTSRENAAQCTVNAMTMAIEAYYNDFGDYPPDNSPSTDGNESLTYAVTTSFQIGERRVGGYLPTSQRMARDGDGNGYWELYSPMGGKFEYRRLHGPGGHPIFVLIDPGHDLRLGGTVDPAKGFVPDGSGADKDNIFRTGQH